MTPWWGRWPLPEDAAATWQIGPLSLWMAHRPGELRLAWRSAGVPLDDRLRLAEPTADQGAPEDYREERFPLAKLDAVRLSPGLADRDVVARPETPITLHSGEETRGYVSLAMWARVGVGERELTQIPIHTPRETWFGNTRAGTLCYASSTHLRLDLAAMPQVPHRAIVPVRIVNRGEDPLHLERLRLPVGQLAIYAGPMGNFTTAVSLVREGGEAARVEVEATAPPEADGAQAVGSPRESDAVPRVLQVFNSLIERGTWT